MNIITTIFWLLIFFFFCQISDILCACFCSCWDGHLFRKPDDFTIPNRRFPPYRPSTELRASSARYRFSTSGYVMSPYQPAPVDLTRCDRPAPIGKGPGTDRFARRVTVRMIAVLDRARYPRLPAGWKSLGKNHLCDTKGKSAIYNPRAPVEIISQRQDTARCEPSHPRGVYHIVS